jgi:hypothetical protein
MERAMSRQPTARQREIHAWMLAYQAAHCAPPTIRELAENLRIGSTNGVTCHLRAMIKHGLVTYRPGARGYVAVSDAAPTPDQAWLRGFAAALGLLWSCTHDASAIRLVLKGSGFNLEALAAAGVPDVDLAGIRAAHADPLSDHSAPSGPCA